MPFIDEDEGWEVPGSPVGLRIGVGHLRTKGLKVCVAAGEEHPSDCIEKHGRVLLVDEERSEGLLGTDDAAHPGEEAVAFHIGHVAGNVRSDLNEGKIGLKDL